VFRSHETSGSVIAMFAGTVHNAAAHRAPILAPNLWYPKRATQEAFSRRGRVSLSPMRPMSWLLSLSLMLPPAAPGRSWYSPGPVPWSRPLEIRAGARTLDVTGIAARPLRVFHVLVDTTLAAEVDPERVRAAAVAAGGVDSLRAGDTLRIHVTGLGRDTRYCVAVTTDAPGDSTLVLTARTVPRLTVRHLTLPGAGGRVGEFAYLPDTVYADSAVRVPLLLFLHGAYEAGDGDLTLPRVLKHGPPRLIVEGRDFPFIVLAPQLPKRWKVWPTALLDAALADAREAWPVDSTRIYLTGLSDGADAAWQYAMVRPERVAAIVPIAARGSTAGICRMREVAVWAFHGERDSDTHVEAGRRLVDAYNSCRPSPPEAARMTVYPGATHDVWSVTYDGTGGYDIYGWLLAHHR
jgi:hypothetical protein